MPIIAIANLKGGVGKTTTAMLLARAACARGLDVVVHDGDPQGSATEWAGRAEDRDDSLPWDVYPANQRSVRRMRPAPGRVDIIDCPPSGDVIDAAASVSDLIVIPTGTGELDLSRAAEVAAVLAESGTPHRALITQARKGTVSEASARISLEAAGIPRFKTVIYMLEEIRSASGTCPEISGNHPLGGYIDVWLEIEQIINA